nr:MAG TPA: hypothetical protein [Caudoviricetes sp.]
MAHVTRNGLTVHATPCIIVVIRRNKPPEQTPKWR